ncbi:hypothetical protein Agub_g2158 [Astrephomene gubernaculifera]|uniref:Katanin p80 WD40 repeat-containing subunit B1 homolog n=1 Tax=Astrephomene gubernaculifera TaxID=47775 RepID=A0AAD3DHT3_9CHLO|nr:hypothetical protein Agub_g2158 [Astrephomene gubernaculifera]
MSNPRYLKLVEFSAHVGDVRCVRIGRKTAGVLVTGGDDKKVNVWAIGKTTASFSLTGHQSSVESVSFDNDEMVVAAGGSNGSIKVFELQSGRVTKSFSGHKVNVTCLAWHPYDATIISGSMDTNVKLWDLRGKEAIMTFKDHKAGVTHVRYSPDGNWVASASADGAVKIWDVRAGRLSADLCQPTKYEITGLEFSPTEYVLATSSRDKVVRFWDLEHFTNIGQTAPEATPVRNIAFNTDGKYIFSAIQDGCKVWSMEPTVQHDYVDVPWFRVSDMTVNTHRGGQRLIGCSFNSSMVGLFYITLRNVRPFCDDPEYTAREPGASVDGNPYAVVGASRSNLVAMAAAAQLPPEGAMRRVSLNDRGTGDSASYGNAGGGYSNGAGRPHSGGTGGAGRPSSGGAGGQSSAARPSTGGTGPQAVGASRPSERANSAGSRMPSSGMSQGSAAMLPPVNVYAPSGAASGSNRYGGQDLGGVGDSAASDYIPSSRSGAAHAAGARPSMVSVGVGVGDSLMRGQLQPDDSRGGECGRAQSQHQRQRPYNDRPLRDTAIEIHAPPYPPRQPRSETPPDSHGGPSGSGMDQRYPWQGGPGQVGAAAGPSGVDRRGGGRSYESGGGGGGHYASVATTDLEAAAALSSRHAMFLGAMKKRAHALSLIRNFVAKADWRGAISCARRCDDTATFSDLLEAMHERRDAFSLDLVGEVVSVVDTVLSLPSDRQIHVGLDVVALHVRFFGPIIRELCSPGSRGVGIDLSFEERRERANKAKLSLQNLVPKLNTLARQNDVLGGRALELASQLAQL